MAVARSTTGIRQLLDVLAVPVWMSGVDGGCAYVNRAWVDLIGQPADRALDQGWREAYIPAIARDALTSIVTRSMRVSRFRLEYRMRRHDGEYAMVAR